MKRIIPLIASVIFLVSAACADKQCAVIELYSGEKNEFCGDCDVLIRGGDFGPDIVFQIYCADYESKGFDHPNVYSVNSREVKQSYLIKKENAQ